MGIDTTMAVLYAQTTLSTQFAHAAAVAPQAAVAVSRILANEAAKQERHQVEKSQKDEKASTAGDGRGDRYSFGSRRRRRQAVQTESEQLSCLAESPVLGNLLNVKV